MNNIHSIAWSDRASKLFSISKNDLYFIASNYFVASPEKYYSRKAYSTYYDFLNECLINNKVDLQQFLADREESINISYKLLNNINKKSIHECEVKIRDIGFVDEHINYNYLQILEGVLSVYVQLAAYMQWMNEGKATSNLDLFNCVEKLSNGRFGYISDVYNNTMRNGIGHGKIIYEETRVHYIDKKENKVTIICENLVQRLDDLIDIVNGFALAYIVFWMKEHDSLGLELPRQLLFEEIKLRSASDNWYILNVINQSILDKSQLAVYIQSYCVSKIELHNRVIDTAIKAAQITKGKFDILFLHITHNKFPGYVKFSIDGLNKLNSDTAVRQDYLSTVIDSLDWFFNGFDESMPASMDSNIFADNVDVEERVSSEELVGYFLYKDIVQFVNANNDFMRVKDARYVYSGSELDKKRIISAIKLSVPELLAHTRKKSKELTTANRHVQIPIKHICISIYEDDQRSRTLRRNGIKPNLICTIQYDANNIGCVKLSNSRIEHFQGFIFNWNHYWRNGEEYDREFLQY
jgi:hypothetical protein